MRAEDPHTKSPVARTLASGGGPVQRTSRRPRRIPPDGDREADAKHLGDKAIRPALRSKLMRDQHDRPDTVLIEELGLCRGQVRMDIAVVNGSLHGYEIKSNRDTLRRLRVQVDLYGKVLDEATLVVGDRLLAAALDVLPPWWGVLLVQQTPHGCVFTTVREAGRNPTRDPRALVELLWFERALALLERCNAARGVRGKPRRVVWDRICEVVGTDEIAAAVRAGLKARATSQVRA